MRSLYLPTVCAVAVFLAGCQGRSPVAYGDANSIIVAVAPELWEQVDATVHLALEPTIRTVRNERTFELTYVSPADERWLTLRLWRQVLVIGSPSDPWLQTLIGSGMPADLPAVIDREDVWAKGQKVTAILLPEEDQAERLVAMLPELHRLLDDRYRGYVYQRMFASGRNEELRDTLLREAGFSLILPKVYRTARLEEAYSFRNTNANTGDIERTVVVAWRPGVQRNPDAEEVLAWRDEIAEAFYARDQITLREGTETRILEGGAGPGTEVQGGWRGGDATYPTGGPFVTRMLACPDQDRTYLLDGWIYAPAKGKYEYMLQLEAILNSFGCGDLPG